MNNGWESDDDYEYAVGQRGGSKRYKSGWKSGITKRPGYKLVKKAGVAVYVQKKPKRLSGYSVFLSDFKKQHKNLEGPSYFKKASSVWRGMSSAEKAKFDAKAKKMGVQSRGGPAQKPLAKAYKDKVKGKRAKSSSRKRKASKSKSKSKSKSRSRKRSKSRSKKSSKKRSKSRSKKSSKKRSKSRSKKRSKSKSKSKSKSQSGRGLFGGNGNGDDDDADYEGGNGNYEFYY